MQNPVIVVLFVKFKESAFDKKEARPLKGGFQPLFIGSLTETDVDHTRKSRI